MTPLTTSQLTSKGEGTRQGSYRIALLPSAYAPAVGGVEVLTARLAHRLRARGHAVEVWAPQDADGLLPQAEVIDGTTVRRFPYPLPRASVASLLAFPPRAVRSLVTLRAAVKAFSPTHLHVQCFSGNGAYATALSRLTGVPLLVTLQGETVMDDQDIYNHSTTLRAALRWGLREADHVTGCSQFTLDDSVTRFGLRPGKASVVFNGVDLEETAPSPVALPFARYVLALGRVVRNKGFDLLLEAFAKVAAHDPALGLVVAGDGPELSHLRRRAAELCLGQQVHFTGRLDRGEVAWVMSHAQVFVMPSRVEPFGIVALEGWRAGIPVIVSSRGGAPEFVEHGVTGLVADPFDADDLAENLRRLIAEPHLRTSLVERAQDNLGAFTWDALAARYEDLYRTIDTAGRGLRPAHQGDGEAG